MEVSGRNSHPGTEASSCTKQVNFDCETVVTGGVPLLLEREKIGATALNAGQGRGRGRRRPRQGSQGL
eukprot:2741426-Rhodomonas_salina.1